MSRTILSLYSVVVMVVAGVGALAVTGKLDPGGPGRWFVDAPMEEERLAGDPGNPYRWCELGEKLASEGDVEGAERCMRRAAELGAEVPPVLMRAANFWMGEARNAEAMELMARILVQTDAFDGVIFSYYRRLGVAVEEVLGRGLPEDRRTWESYFRDLLRWAEPGDVLLVWERMRERGWGCEEGAEAYTHYLTGRGLYDKAVSAWAGYLGERAGEFPGGSRVFNGGFERAIGGSAMGWRVREVEGVRAERAREGEGWALLVEFDGTRNVVFRDVWQRVYVPKGTWRLRARVRTEGVTTNEGIYLRVDGGGPGLRWRSEKLIGTSEGWVEIEGTLRVGGETAAVQVMLGRDESLKIDNKIWGRVWLDDVRVERLGG